MPRPTAADTEQPAQETTREGGYNTVILNSLVTKYNNFENVLVQDILDLIQF